jgi:hypothetical protein
MCFFISLFPATFWAVIGYFVLFSTARVEGGIQLFGKILAIWIFIIALFIPIAGAYMAISGSCPIEQHFEKMMEHHRYSG